MDAYVNNMVNCSLLLDDAEAKEAAMEEIARLEAALEASESTAKQQAASFKVSSPFSWYRLMSHTREGVARFA